VVAPINARVRSLTRTRRPSAAGEVGGLESGSVGGPPGSAPATDARDRRKTARPIARAES
jgi:hypothetical protein